MEYEVIITNLAFVKHFKGKKKNLPESLLEKLNWILLDSCSEVLKCWKQRNGERRDGFVTS